MWLRDNCTINPSRFLANCRKTLCRTRQRDSSSALVVVTSHHISPVLRQLHWLPVRHLLDFKLALLVYKALHDATAAYLVDDCQLVSHAGRRRLRSADIDTCCVPRTNTRLGVGASQPLDHGSGTVCQPDNDIGEFRQQLKSFLFN